MEIDETGKKAGGAEIDDGGTRGNGEGSTDFADSIAFDDDHHRLERLASTAVDQAARFHHGDLGFRRAAENEAETKSQE
jgi:hypothetical protein